MELYFTGGFVEATGNHSALYAKSISGQDRTVFWFKINDRDVPMGELKQGIKELGVFNPDDSIWTDTNLPTKYEPTETDMRYGTELYQIQKAYNESRLAELISTYESSYQDSTAIVWVIFDMNTKLKAINDLVADDQSITQVLQKVSELNIEVTGLNQKVQEFSRAMESATTKASEVVSSLNDDLVVFKGSVSTVSNLLNDILYNIKQYIIDLKANASEYLNAAGYLNNVTLGAADYASSIASSTTKIEIAIERAEKVVADVDSKIAVLNKTAESILASIKFDNQVESYSEVAENVANTLVGIKNLLHKEKERI